MASRVESDFYPPKFTPWRGRWTTSWNIITNQGVSGPEFHQLFLQNIHLRKQSMEFLQFWDQHRGSFSRISPAGWSFSYAPANRSWSGPLQNLGFWSTYVHDLSNILTNRISETMCLNTCHQFVTTVQPICTSWDYPCLRWVEVKADYFNLPCILSLISFII